MDILDRLLDAVEKKLGPDVFPRDMAEDLERQFRFDYGADTHYIASLRAYEVEKRHEEVKRLIGAGLSNSDIAERVGITRQQAWNIRQALSNGAP